MSPTIIQNTVNHLESNPGTGSVLTIVHVILASVLKIISNGRVNPLIMDCIQIGAWAIAMIVGVISIIGYIKKGKGKTDPEPKKESDGI